LDLTVAFRKLKWQRCYSGFAKAAFAVFGIADRRDLFQVQRMDGFLLALVVFAYLLAGFVKGVIGMGLPTVAMGVLAAIMSPAQAAAILVAPSLATNIWQMVAGPYLVDLIKRLGGMLLGMFIGAWLGNGILTGANAKPAAIGLGIVLIAYALIGLSKMKFSVPRASEIWLGPIVGVLTGVVMAATGVFVIPALPYLQAVGFEKDELVQALGLHFSVSTVALALVLWDGGAFNLSLGTLSLFAIVPAVVGMYAGQRVRTRISPETFRVCLYVGLLALGVFQVGRNVM
jgi:uncharacterized membrane protein YfcA